MHEEKSWRVTIRSNLSVPKYIFYCKTSKERINVVNGNWGIAPSPPCDTENGICSFAFFLILTLWQFFLFILQIFDKERQWVKVKIVYQEPSHPSATPIRTGIYYPKEEIKFKNKIWIFEQRNNWSGDEYAMVRHCTV